MTAGGLVPISKREPWYTLVLLLLPPAPSYKERRKEVKKRERGIQRVVIIKRPVLMAVLKGLSYEIDFENVDEF